MNQEPYTNNLEGKPNPKPRPKPNRNDPLTILKTRKQTHGRPATIAGPMVRYSKLPFRLTCKHYNTDIVYTPMILAREYVRNPMARISDFSTNTIEGENEAKNEDEDSPLVFQVGVNNVTDLLRVCEMVCPYVDAVSINCGCPIKEQVREGIGSALIFNEELLVEMVSKVKAKYGDKLRLETKIRIHERKTPYRTLELCKRLCKAGVDWITVHGRLRTMRSSDAVDLDAIKFLVDGLKADEACRDVPIVANGDCFTLQDMERIAEYTGADGIMSARGLLDNPALFAGYTQCPWGCLERFIYYFIESGGLPFQLLQHHVHCMLSSMRAPKNILKQVMSHSSLPELLDWLDTNFVIKRYGEQGFGESVDIQYRLTT